MHDLITALGLTVPDTAILTGVLLALGAIIQLLRRAAPMIRHLSHAADDILGEPARPGVEARKGVMERLAQIETAGAAKTAAIEALQVELHEVRTAQSATAANVARVLHMTHPNGGSSIPDRLARIEQQLSTPTPTR